MTKLKMPELNMVMISGNLTKAPTLRKTSAGTSVANFYVASNRKFKDKSGFWKEDVCYVGVVAWHQLADSCENFLKKGSAILIEGELQSRSWEGEDGAYRSIVEVKAHKIQFLNAYGETETEELSGDEVHANQQDMEN